MGGTPPPLAAPPRWDLGLAAPLGVGNPRAPPLALAPIYSGGEGGHPYMSPWRLPPSRDTSSSPVGAWRSPAGLPRSSIITTPLCCCWMESSSTSPSLLAGSRRGRHRRAVRVLNSEVPYVRYLISRIVKTYDCINRVVITLLLTVYEGTWTTLSALVSIHHLDGSCMCVGIFLKLLRSQQWHPSQVYA